VLVAIAFTWPLPMHLRTQLTGDPGGDTGVYVWNQWVFRHEALTARTNPLTTDQILSLSYRADLTQHNYTAFLDVLALPLQPLLGVVATFNLLFLAMSVLTAWCTYLLARRTMDATRLEAWIAGLAFAWSPALVARGGGHFSLVAAAPLPAFCLCLVRAERSRRTSDAALAGAAVAWAAFCDAYYAVFCLLIAGLYIATSVFRIVRAETRTRAPWLWLIDVLAVTVGGLIVGLVFRGGGQLEVLGIGVSVRGLYTPVLALTVLVTVRVLLTWRPRVVPVTPLRPVPVRLAVVALMACAAPLSPVLYGLGTRIADGRFVSPPVLWRSSPDGVDLLALFTPNPNHPLVQRFTDDAFLSSPAFLEYTAALSLVALGVIALAVWQFGFRPRAGWWWLTGGFALLALGPFVHVAGFNTYVPGPWSLLRYVPLVGFARTPTRFAIVAALGVAILLAGAVAAIGQRHPNRRRAVGLAVLALLIVELWPAPRMLYAARIASVYDVVAADPRPVRLLEFPTGVRDGASSTGNFSARAQFNQTRHGKKLIGGYLSRISPRRLADMRHEHPTYARLMTLSEQGWLSKDDTAVLLSYGENFCQRANVGYVAIDYGRTTEAAAALVRRALRLDELARDGNVVLYRPRP
jgi:hypothetical protein